MNISDIKHKARSVFQKRRNIISVYIFISVITAVTSYLARQLGSALPFIPALITIAMIPFSHGNIVTALKTVNEQGDEISVGKEGLAGFKRFRELFYTYLIQEVFLIVVLMLTLLFMAITAKAAVDASVFNDLSAALTRTTDINVLLNDSVFCNAIDALGMYIIFGAALMIIVSIIYTLTFALTPYILEKYNLRGIKAMAVSARLMKKYKGTLFLLYLSYVGWAILVMAISLVVGLVLPSPFIIQILSAVLSIHLFAAEMQTSVAVFFEEVALENKL